MTVGQEFGSLLAGLPAYVNDPPIEAVCFAFGVSEDGQLGLDATGNVLTPKVLEALLGTRLRGRAFGRTPLVAGSRSSVAISADGDVYTWGWNSRASLGQGHRDHVPKPRRVAGLRGVPIVQVALGGWHTLLLDNQGQIWACGGDEYMQSGQAAKERDVLVPTMCLPALRVCQVSAGGMHSLALTEDGNLWTWGEPWGSFSMTIDRRPHRVEVEGPEEIVDRGGFVAIACGAFHNLALTATGEIYSFGLNDYGQLGLGHTASVTAPQRIVDGLEGVTVAEISCGGWHSACVSTSGEVFMWGRGEYGRLGLGDRSGSSKLRPAKIWALEGVKMVQVSCGGSHTLGVTADGKAWAWGRGSFGRLGTGEERDAISPVEVKLPGGPERWHVIAVAAGGRHSMAFAVPDNGNLLEERSSQSGWEQQQRQRSPMGLSPQSSGIRLNSAAIAAAAAGKGGNGDDQLTDGGGADDELSTSPDGESPISSGRGGDGHATQLQIDVDRIDINIPPPSQNNHQVQHPQQQQHEAAEEAGTDTRQVTDNNNDNNQDDHDNNNDENDGLFEENSLEELIAQAPVVVPTSAFLNTTASTALSATAPVFSPAGDAGNVGVDGLGVGTHVESLLSQGVASLNLQSQEQQQQQQQLKHGGADVAAAQLHQAPYVELSPSMQRSRHYRGTGGGTQAGGRSQSPKRDTKAVQEKQEEEEDEYEYGNSVVEPSEQESDSETDVVGREARSAASLAAATMHGLRDDLLGDKS
ncbi:hypothetical protein Ndes2526B_g08991 [Nannochloris sp. 'desiccata']